MRGLSGKAGTNSMIPSKMTALQMHVWAAPPRFPVSANWEGRLFVTSCHVKGAGGMLSTI